MQDNGNVYLKWQISENSNGDLPIGNEKGKTLIFKGHGDLHMNVFEQYVDEFMLKYRRYDIMKGDRKLGNVVDKDGKIKKEWSVTIFIKNCNCNIDYPGYVKNI